MKEAKRCIICRKILSSNNKHCLCSYHYKEYYYYWRKKGMSAWLEKLKIKNVI